MKIIKTVKIIVGSAGLLLIFRLINPDLTKKITILDCESTYKKSVFGKEYEGYNYHNAKMDIAKCLSEKFLATKNQKYEIEIRKILNEFEAYDEIKKDPIENICKDRETIFIYWYYE
jgi:hypothetical protein